ncbi:thioesterase domain-containing protein [Streptomyces sp. NPDC048361]|uniref:thioesterase II family protein n=1 Tax=Streptomyces sp. NPDC048361 TaxID=3154720 RepID=UPI0034166817
MAVQSRRGPEAKWFRRFGPAHESRALRLFCFHYAGGSAASFRDWQSLLPPYVEVVGVQLPGRENRFAEQPFRDMRPLAEAIADAMAAELDPPYACFGFSMGARVALAVSHLLRERGLPQPSHMFFASSCAPSRGVPVRGWNESDEKLIAYLRELGGTAAEIFDSQEFLDMYLPTVRADLTVVGTCPPRSGLPLAVPLRAFAGLDDTEAPPERMRDWYRETSAAFSLTTVPGGHFFDPAGTTEMISQIASDLECTVRNHL